MNGISGLNLGEAMTAGGIGQEKVETRVEGKSPTKGVSGSLESCPKANRLRAQKQEGQVRLTCECRTLPRLGTEEQITVALESLIEDGTARLRGRSDVVLELEAGRGDGVVPVGGLDVLGPRPQGCGRPSERCRQQQREPEFGACHGPPVS